MTRRALAVVTLLCVAWLLALPARAENVRELLREAAGEQPGTKPEQKQPPVAAKPSPVKDFGKPYHENIIIEVGAMQDGSTEEKYALALQKEVGGQRLHGDYTLDDLVGAIVPRYRATNRIDNLYFCGHIVLIPAKNMPEVKPVTPSEDYVGFLLVGKQSKDRCLNLNRQFLDKLDKKMSEAGLTPDKVYNKGARIAIRVCLVARYMPDFLDAWAERVPEGCTIEAYTVPFVWSTATWYPLVSNVFGAFNTKYLFGQQAQGLTLIPGKWKPPVPKVPPASRRERVPDFAGMENR
ncbi:MAG: hypothetical protein HY303_19150 [Candidatus Wallbacteria bacterium]|nr:hypothetical protein [Candidatus Wallbacteria bacterium]